LAGAVRACHFRVPRATLVKAPVGVLQSQRLNREAHIDVATFTDESELLAWLDRGG
jgi:hypothetical protein